MTATPDHHGHSQRWTGAEFKALLIALLALIVWGGSFALFGFAGLITPALVLVATVGTLLVLVSRG